MQRLVHHYIDDHGLDNFVQHCKQIVYKNCFVRIYTAGLFPEEAVKVARKVKELIPYCTVIGASSSQSIIYNGEQIDNATIIIFDNYDKVELKIELMSWSNKSPEEFAKEVHTSFTSSKSLEDALVHILFSDSYHGVQKFIDEINTYKPFMQLAGGLVGDKTPEYIPGFLFSDTGVHKDSAFVFTAHGDAENNFVHSTTSFDVISHQFKITKADEGFIEEIENEAALNWMYDFLSINEEQMLSSQDYEEVVNDDYLIHFPLILDEESGCGRFTKYNAKANKLSLYHSTIDTGTKFRLGYLNPARTISEMHEMCSEVIDVPVEELFAYVCFAKKIYLKNCAQWEMRPFHKLNISGIFMMGEISHYKGKNYFHNGASVFTGIAENEKYVIPDVFRLEEAQMIADEISFLEKAKQKQKEHINLKQAKLYAKLSKLEQKGDYDKYIDKNLFLPNIYQFELDRKRYGMEMICVTENQTADAVIAFAGEENFYKATRDVLEDISENLSKVDPAWRVYSINYKTYVVAYASELQKNKEEFTDFCLALYKAYEYATSDSTGFTGVSRFVVLFNQPDMLGTAATVLYANKNSQDNFIICEDEVKGKINSGDELDKVTLLKQSIDNDSVTPYYQGIHNNKLGKIDKYEALMRIIDDDGTIHAPHVFLDNAKKFKFYKRISRMMIDKALKDFESRKESLSINISVYDVESMSFRNWFLERLKKFPEPHRIIVEFLETESYESLDVLFEFLNEIHKIGSKFAVDDFGAGYSTLSMIVSLKPDFLKIDGSIIRDIVENDDKKIILETVQHLANRMNTQLVAEFVENEEIQNFLKNAGVHYSQGFFLARPRPIEELDS